MMGLLARREHSRQELFSKMSARGFDPELIEANIIDFIEQGWQSDDRYARMLVRNRVIKCHGPLKIKNELKQKGISETRIQQCMQEKVNWAELARDALDKRFANKPSSPKEKAKQYRFLQQRGFTYEQIKQASNPRCN